jgi:hypothetical protein
MQESYTNSVELIPTYIPLYQLDNNYKQYEPADENDVNVPLYINPEIPQNDTNQVKSYSNYCGIFLLLLAFVSFFIGLSIVSLKSSPTKNSTY